MKKLQLLQKITDNGVVAVLRADSADQVIAMAEQAIAGGIKVIEITMTVPSALKAIEKLSRGMKLHEDDIFGETKGGVCRFSGEACFRSGTFGFFGDAFTFS